jgi:hypothetical protein
MRFEQKSPSEKIQPLEFQTIFPAFPKKNSNRWKFFAQALKIAFLLTLVP